MSWCFDGYRDGEDAEARIAELEAQLAHYHWRPIAEIHEDFGPCVLMDIYDPGYMEIGSNLDPDFDEGLWTHFAEVPKLSHDEAVKLKASIKPGRRADAERFRLSQYGPARAKKC